MCENSGTRRARRNISKKLRISGSNHADREGRCRLHGGASGSGGPPGERNGQYRHGERTKAAIAERQIQRIAEDASRWPDVNLAAEYESEAPY
jgi:hypothetical protein